MISSHKKLVFIDLKKAFHTVDHDILCEKLQIYGVQQRVLSKNLSRNTLNELYKLYVRPHLDYGDVIYHITQKEDNFSSLGKSFDGETGISTVRCCTGSNRNVERHFSGKIVQ